MQVAKWQTWSDLDKAGHGESITTGYRSGNMAGNHQSHISVDSAI